MDAPVMNGFAYFLYGSKLEKSLIYRGKIK